MAPMRPISTAMPPILVYMIIFVITVVVLMIIKFVMELRPIHEIVRVGKLSLFHHRRHRTTRILTKFESGRGAISKHTLVVSDIYHSSE